jgi:hypothetical protein
MFVRRLSSALCTENAEVSVLPGTMRKRKPEKNVKRNNAGKTVVPAKSFPRGGGLMGA